MDGYNPDDETDDYYSPSDPDTSSSEHEESGIF